MVYNPKVKVVVRQYIAPSIFVFIVLSLLYSFHFERDTISHYPRSLIDIRSITSRLHHASMMSEWESSFIFTLLLKYKPKKIVEVGVASGGSSAVILSAIQNITGAHLYSIDKTRQVYVRHDKPVGYIVSEQFPELMKKWTLYTKVITADVIESIGKGIDCVLLDTTHTTPGELLDFLEVLPFLKSEALVIIHDICLQFTNYGSTKSSGQKRHKLMLATTLLYSNLRGLKLTPPPSPTRTYWNIGAVRLEKNQKRYYYDYFFPLAFNWEYLPAQEDLRKIRQFLQIYYDKECIRLYDEALIENKIFLSQYKQNDMVLSRTYNV